MTSDERAELRKRLLADKRDPQTLDYGMFCAVTALEFAERAALEARDGNVPNCAVGSTILYQIRALQAAVKGEG